MKYYQQLSNIEEQIIRLDTIESLIRATTSDDVRADDAQKIIWHVSDLIQETNKNLTEKFYELWDVVREDTQDYKTEFVPVEQKKYSYNDLSEVMKVWAHSEK